MKSYPICADIPMSYRGERMDIEKEYFEWIYSLVRCKKKRGSYRKLLTLLHSIDYRYSIPMDGNRAEDGTDLRYRFALANDISDHAAAAELDCRPCSVLEMMTALCVRCEENIMDNPEFGNRTAQWFMEMLESLGLSKMTDSHFREREARDIVERFLDREYAKDGVGGLFTIPNCPFDLRCVEIWYQAMWYLNRFDD